MNFNLSNEQYYCEYWRQHFENIFQKFHLTKVRHKNNVEIGHYDFATKIGLLNKTSYRDGVQRKVFLMERIASALLATESHWQVGNYNTFLCAYSASRLNEFPGECHTADALKMAWNQTKNDFFIYEFHKLIFNISNKLSSV